MLSALWFDDKFTKKNVWTISQWYTRKQYSLEIDNTQSILDTNIFLKTIEKQFQNLQNVIIYRW